MNYIYLIENVLENKKDWIDYIGILINLISTFGSIAIALWALRLSDKQNKISKHQSDIDKCHFIYESFIKEKQEKIIKLRNLYLDFKDSCLYILSTIFPVSISKKNQKPLEIPKFDIKNTSDLLSVFLRPSNTKNDSNTFIINGKKDSEELFFFLDKNKVFLQDNLELFDDLYKVSKAFCAFFEEIIKISYIKNLFISFSKIIDSRGTNLIYTDISKNELLYSKIKYLREFFYRFIHYRLILQRIGSDGIITNNHLLYIPSNSIFKDKEIYGYTEENIKKWSENELIAFATHAIFNDWFDFWLKSIDSFFDAAFGNINKTINNKMS